MAFGFLRLDLELLKWAEQVPELVYCCLKYNYLFLNLEILLTPSLPVLLLIIVLLWPTASGSEGVNRWWVWFVLPGAVLGQTDDVSVLHLLHLLV